MANLKCAKCGAEITEEQLTCSACGFVNDIEVCKKLAGQEEIALQAKAEKEREEKRAEKELKLTKDQETLYACVKKTNTLFVVLRILGILVLFSGLFGAMGELISLIDKTNQMVLSDELAKIYIAEGLMIVKGQGIAILLGIGFAISGIANNLRRFTILNVLSKKINELNFDGDAWLKDFQKSKCVDGITLEKALRKQNKDTFYLLAITICNKNNPEAKALNNKKLSHLLSAIIEGLGAFMLGFVLIDLVLWVLYSAGISTPAIVLLVIGIVAFIANIAVAGVIDGKATKAVSEELKKFDVQPEQPTQPEQNA